MASSFECDGCGHHASYHDMENSKDDAIVKRWQEIEKEQQQAHEELGTRKRPRKAIEDGGISGQMQQLMVNTTSSGTSRRGAKKATGTRSTRQRSQVRANIDELERVFELSDG